MTYKQLTELHSRLHARGLEILAVPSNDFRQEPGSNEEIREFVEAHFHSRFHMLSKAHVNGPHQDPIYALLKSHIPGDVPHNFYKYLVDKKGLPVHRFGKKEEPLSFEEQIVKLLDG